jgi:hypothetical protein
MVPRSKRLNIYSVFYNLRIEDCFGYGNTTHFCRIAVMKSPLLRGMQALSQQIKSSLRDKYRMAVSRPEKGTRNEI